MAHERSGLPRSRVGPARPSAPFASLGLDRLPASGPILKLGPAAPDQDLGARMPMTTRMRQTAVLGLVAIAAGLLLLCAQAARAETVSPLPASDYTVKAACPAPAPGHAACLALQLVARTAAARAYTHPLGIARAAVRAPSAAPSPSSGELGLRPQDLHSAYRLPTEAGSTQTIALVDAYNDPNAEADLESYDSEFGLPKCTTANGCFEQLNQNGKSSPLPFPQTDTELTSAESQCSGGNEEDCFLAEEAEGWSVEISLDIETAHATCQNCHIALVEADSTGYEDLESAEEGAVRVPANEVSNSWGGPECIEGVCVGESAAFNHPGVVIAAAAGDDGFLNWLAEPSSAYPDFPADLPQVVAVGGTRLSALNGSGEWTGERVWNDGGEETPGGESDGFGAGGGGCATRFTAEPWQTSVSDWARVGCGTKRAVADVSADADPYSGVAVYDSSDECTTPYLEEIEKNHKKEPVERVLDDWCTIGGTSLASPLIASTYALAGGAQGVRYPARTLYKDAVTSPTSLHDITDGSNGRCSLPFEDVETGESPCTSAEEAQASCGSRLICLAAPGYDGPTGVGTPDGIAAFEAPAGASEEAEEKETEEAQEELREEEKARAKERTHGFPPPENTNSTVVTTWPAPTTTATNTDPTAVQLTGLALTPRALVALNRRRPKVSQLAFQFTLSVATHVSVSLQERVGKRGHRHWKLVQHSSAIAVAGHNSHRLAGGKLLGVGSYRLTLAPTGGTARSLSFNIG
jgi:hypothetical protein